MSGAEAASSRCRSATGSDADVHSFDFDPASVAATETLRARFFPDDRNGVVEQGDATDAAMEENAASGRRLRRGSLHHTGSMWRAVDLTTCTVSDGGTLFCRSTTTTTSGDAWGTIKRLYNGCHDESARFVRRSS
jgi:2-polyprenyl-6-hydroxyphenyl methylase/3-demethylubiquinone-9 3-methyltransferase